MASSMRCDGVARLDEADSRGPGSRLPNKGVGQDLPPYYPKAPEAEVRSWNCVSCYRFRFRVVVHVTNCVDT
jgi:hypothetical protein